ncbi:DUF3570 domain-containing protein [Puia dinghuensis]|uniref:DUF3570 domain-containing protein n=1 Tax=Puia dinghuensis TaxID=1792502 RepID=A0A8J2UHW0_9BACT|nr:DUF3570 domain-containing protein [Puia dinghuensis]GGB18339.1 hypothetical protein GCM10011511_47710 [Puia dinghuensis]
MKNKYLTLAMLSAVLHASSQKHNAMPDSLYKKQRISTQEVQVLFSYYAQDGNHSAITGGIGTEWLHVYAPEFTITHRPDSIHTYKLNGGIDVITSASMDKIDFDAGTGASRVSARMHLSPAFSYQPRGSRTTYGVNTGFSIESAYLSIPAGISISHVNKTGTREVSGSVQCYFDDLRYGRLALTYHGPLELVYPVELRDTSWFNIYRRYSYNFDFAFYQVINARMQLAIFPEFVLQKGLLSTPYHRVFFNDDHTERVENLPRERTKWPIGLQLNSFVGDRVILRSYYRFYHDNFGINAHTWQLEVPIELTQTLTLAPLARFYMQTAADYFRPDKAADPKERYYTSDYDLSKFTSYKAGVTARYAPRQPLGHHFFFDAITVRYSYYRRSDGLYGHTLSLLLEASHTHPAEASPRSHHRFPAG